MTDRWTNRLSEYVDGDLAADERAELDRHLADCPSCAELVERLRDVVAAARELPDRAPSTDLWGGVAARIGASVPAPAAEPAVVPLASRRPARRVSLAWWQAAAAVVVLVGGSVVAARVVPFRAPPAGSARAGGTPGAVVVPASQRGRMPGPRYDSTVAELERAVDLGKGRLDTATVRVIEENLRIIDGAIEQAQRALAADPNNLYLNNHLAGTLKRKIELLRRASSIVRQT